MSGKLLALLCVGAISALGESLRGRVDTDDGLPVPAATEVALHCGGSLHPGVVVDAQGWFEIPGPADPLGCSAVISAPGYRTARIPLAALPAHPQIPAAVLHRLGKSHGESISVTHLAAPAEAKRHFHAAARILERAPAAGTDRALEHLRGALRAYPAYAQAWFEVGRLQLALGDGASALRAFRRSIEADPWFVSPYAPLLLLLESVGDSKGAAKACAGLRRINPALPPGCR